MMSSPCFVCRLPLDPAERRACRPEGLRDELCFSCPDCGVPAWCLADWEDRGLTLGELIRLGERARRQR
jgi:hypothetical protein